jgi:uncharacterized protein YndB with AHSA1/START domain
VSVAVDGWAQELAGTYGREGFVTADVMVIVERQFDYPQQVVFDAWTDPLEMQEWRGSPGWHVERETNTGDMKLGGRHHHVKVVDDDPENRVTTDGVFTEWYPAHVFVSRERITGDAGIDPNIPLELRVELVKMGKGGTLVRIVQGPYEASESQYHTTGWERELGRLETFLALPAVQEATR